MGQDTEGQMKVPDNFILILLVVGVWVLASYLPMSSESTGMLSQLWAVLLTLVKPDQAMLPHMGAEK
jgi:hypothetical protein